MKRTLLGSFQDDNVVIKISRGSLSPGAKSINKLLEDARCHTNSEGWGAVKAVQSLVCAECQQRLRFSFHLELKIGFSIIKLWKVSPYVDIMTLSSDVGSGWRCCSRAAYRVSAQSCINPFFFWTPTNVRPIRNGRWEKEHQQPPVGRFLVIREAARNTALVVLP